MELEKKGVGVEAELRVGMTRLKRQVEKTENKLRHYNGTMVSRTNRNNNILGQNKSNDAITDNGNAILVAI